MRFLEPLLRAITIPQGTSAPRAVLRLITILAIVIGVFSGGFLLVAAWEGRTYNVWAAIYWTVVTMSTLGYGDIVLASDLGRLYSLVVLAAGAILILVLLPFTFIQVIYVPWRAAARQAQTPRSLPATLRDHLLLTNDGDVEQVLIRRARAAGIPYAIIVEDVDRAVHLHESGHTVMVGALDDPDTYFAARADQARMVFSARSDQANSNVAFTLREATDRPMLVVTANASDSVDVLELAGADHVLMLGDLLGRQLARRIVSPTDPCHVVAEFDELTVAELAAAGTRLVGQPLRELDIRAQHGVSVVALWDRGRLQIAQADTVVGATAILVVAGRTSDLERYVETIAHDGVDATVTASGRSVARNPGVDHARRRHPVVVIGGGRVGRAVSTHLAEAGISSRIVERDPTRRRPGFDYVIGDAADRSVLHEAGLDDTDVVVVTTHDDDTNVFLTLYARRLRGDALIFGRVAHERNLSTMYRAGADLVLSYASTGATEVWNHFHPSSTVLVTEGLIVFSARVSPRLAGRTLRVLDLPSTTGCTVIGIVDDRGATTRPDPDRPLVDGARLILIGDEDAEVRFSQNFRGPSRRLRRR